MALIVSLATVILLASLIRRGGWLRVAGVVIAIPIFTIFAFCTLSMIRT